MGEKNKLWKKIFFICIGIFAGTAFCMKWMENDLVYNGEKFSILGLELTYSKEKILNILAGLDEKTRTILKYHLSFDFAFMIGAYGCIAALCMLAAKRNASGKFVRKILIILALLQLVACACDIMENIYLLQWVKTGFIGAEFDLFHLLVYTKWGVAMAGLLMGLAAFAFRQSSKVAPEF